MTAQELIIELMAIGHLDMEVAILDSFNGGGVPRKIDLGPLLDDGKPHFEGDTERPDHSDLDTPDGQPIIVMGYGCY